MSELAKLEDPEQILLTAIGNPNVDIIIELEDDSLIKKYDLTYDCTKRVDEEFLIKIENDFKKLNPKILRFPGGSAHNTLRIFQRLVDCKFSSCMIGGVGEDDDKKYLKDELEKLGVLTSYTLKPPYKTGFIFLFIFKNKVAPVYGGPYFASWKYSVDDFLADGRALEAIKESKFVLLEGFFLFHGHSVGKKAMEMCFEHRVVSVLNLCAEYVAESEVIKPYIKSCNIVIGNKIEFQTLCKLLEIASDDFETSLKDVFDIMKQEKNTPELGYKVKSMNEHEKILIVTCGSDPVYCLTGTDPFIKFEVPVIEKEMEKDDLGAGDSFLAGFLCGMLLNSPIRKCLELASLVGAEVVQNRGCVMPEKVSTDCFMNRPS